MFYLEIFFISLILTIFLTPYLIKFLNKNGVVDKPGERRVNKKIVPRMGGAVILAVVLSVVLLFGKDVLQYWPIFAAAVAIGITGIIDDVKGVNWKLKFGAQFLTAGLLFIYFMGKFTALSLFGINFYYPFSCVILFFFIVGVLNAINLMDGLDGLVSGYSFITFSVLLALNMFQPDGLSIILLISLLGSLLGFMKFNTYPAKIFLGDTGSLVLGFFITFLALNTSLKYNKTALDLTFPLILLAVPILDTLRVMTVRMLQGNSPFLPDQNHLHHIILKNGVKHRNTVFTIQIITSLFALLAILYIDSKSPLMYPLFFALLFVLAFIKRAINFVRSVIGLKRFFKSADHLIDRFGDVYRKYIILASIPVVAVIIYLNYPGAVSTLSFGEIKALLVWFIVVTSLALFHQFNSTIINHIYVYFNIILFFLLNNLGHQFETLFDFGGVPVSELLVPISVLVLFIVTILFFLIRGLGQKERERFLSGLDLVMLLFVAMAMIVPNMIHFGKISLIGINLLIAFMLYLWYRIFSYVNSKYEKILFYLSFALPASSLIRLLL